MVRAEVGALRSMSAMNSKIQCGQRGPAVPARV